MSSGRLLHGQQYDQAKNQVRRFTERMEDKVTADAKLGNARTEITPNSEDSSLVRIWSDPTDLDTLVISGPSRASLSFLPDVLTSISVVYNQNKVSGEYGETNTGFSEGDHRDLTVSLNGNATGSVSIIPEILFEISPFSVWGRNVPSTRYFFFMTGPVNTATILARLTTIIGSPVLALPMFKPVPHNLVLKGQSVSIRVEARVRQSDYNSNGSTFTAYSLDKGAGSSYDGQVSFRTVQLSPTVHSALNITSASLSDKANATSQAIITGGQNFPPQSVIVEGESPIITASVTPSTLAATSPTTVPTTGLYLIDSSFESDQEWGRTKVFAEVVDFSIFA